MRKLKQDLTGIKFGKLNVVSQAYGRDKNQRVLWNVRCDCGNEKVLTTSSIKKSKSCGCLVKNYFRDITGLKINYLEVLRYVGKNKYKNCLYECSCKCGKMVIAEKSDIEKQRIKSCGCLKIERSKERIYSIEESLVRQVYRDYMAQARTRSRFFDLPFNFFMNKVLANCEYCDRVPSNLKKRVKDDTQLLYSGIDRVDNDKGYTIDNCKTACYDCNQGKHTLTEKAFYLWVERTYKYLKTKGLVN